jgi:hypothetical protein
LIPGPNGSETRSQAMGWDVRCHRCAQPDRRFGLDLD